MYTVTACCKIDKIAYTLKLFQQLIIIMKDRKYYIFNGNVICKEFYYLCLLVAGRKC